MSGKIFQVSKEAQGRAKIAELRQQMDEIEVPPVAPEPPPAVPGQSLESLVENELKLQMTKRKDRELDWTITTAIKFLAVRAKIPIAFGSELDEGAA